MPVSHKPPRQSCHFDVVDIFDILGVLPPILIDIPFKYGCSVGLRSGDDGGQTVTLSSFFARSIKGVGDVFCSMGWSRMKRILFHKARFFLSYHSRKWSVRNSTYRTYLRDSKGTYRLTSQYSSATPPPPRRRRSRGGTGNSHSPTIRSSIHPDRPVYHPLVRAGPRCSVTHNSQPL